MGLEATCRATYRSQSARGKAKLETDVIQFRGAYRLDIPLRGIRTAAAQDGVLNIQFSDEEASFELGPIAAKWADKILHPKTRAQKLGLKPGLDVMLSGFDDPKLVEEVEQSGARLETSAKSHLDVIFIRPQQVSALDELPRLRKILKPDGCIWILAPKGSKVVRETDVLAAGKRHGLTDTKVVRFSDTLTAHKFVIPVADRQLRHTR